MTGPAFSTVPKGVALFKAVTYRVQCSERQYNRERAHADDHSDLIIEGYLELRLNERGKPYVGVVTTSLVSQLA